MCGQLLNILSSVFGLFSSIYFFLGSKQKSWEIQTWGNSSDAEIKFYREQNSKIKVAFVLLFLSFLIQLISSIF
jgi:hypothetical protein